MVEDPTKYLPIMPLEGWWWVIWGTTEGTTDGYSFRLAYKHAAFGDVIPVPRYAILQAITCENEEALAKLLTSTVNESGLEVVKTDFLGDQSWELRGPYTSAVVWRRGRVAGIVAVAAEFGTERNDAYAWVAAIDNLMKPSDRNKLVLMLTVGLVGVGLVWMARKKVV